MSARFSREGLAYRFAPAEAPVVLLFSRPAEHRDELTFEVAVRRPDGQHVLTRRVNILGSSTRGSIKELGDELSAEVKGPDWRKLLREACESVLASHRAGSPLHTVAGEMQRPAPPEWLCEGLLLKNKPNVWLGAASTGKSTLAKAICVYYAAGYRFCERPMEQGVPLYLDWEDDVDDFMRVAYDVCRNLGVWPVPLMLWRDMHGRRLRDQIESLATIIDREHVGLLVIDAIAAAGGPPSEHSSWESVALELEVALGALPPVTILGLDHVTSQQHQDGSVVPLKARGAERKVEFIRNQWTLMLDREAQAYGRHLVQWFNTKINRLKLGASFVTELLHYDAELSVVVRPLDTSTEAFERLSDTQKCVRYLQDTPAQTVAEVTWAVFGVSTRNKIESTRVLLKRAQARGLVWVDDGGRWWAKQLSANGQLPFDPEDA